MPQDIWLKSTTVANGIKELIANAQKKAALTPGKEVVARIAKRAIVTIIKEASSFQFSLNVIGFFALILEKALFSWQIN